MDGWRARVKEQYTKDCLTGGKLGNWNQIATRYNDRDSSSLKREINMNNKQHYN